MGYESGDYDFCWRYLSRMSSIPVSEARWGLMMIAPSFKIAMVPLIDGCSRVVCFLTTEDLAVSRLRKCQLLG